MGLNYRPEMEREHLLCCTAVLTPPHERSSDAVEKEPASVATTEMRNEKVTSQKLEQNGETARTRRTAEIVQGIRVLAASA